MVPERLQMGIGQCTPTARQQQGLLCCIAKAIPHLLTWAVLIAVFGETHEVTLVKDSQTWGLVSGIGITFHSANEPSLFKIIMAQII